MKKSVRSPGSATVINAIATGFGAAFGIGLDIKCCANTQNSSITCSNDVGAPTTLMEICAKKTFEKYGISSDDFGMNFKTESELPMASGLSSSSALSNAVVSISSKIIAEEFNLMPLDDLEIINLAIDASLEAKVTITGHLMMQQLHILEELLLQITKIENSSSKRKWKNILFWFICLILVLNPEVLMLAV